MASIHPPLLVQVNVLTVWPTIIHASHPFNSTHSRPRVRTQIDDVPKPKHDEHFTVTFINYLDAPINVRTWLSICRVQLRAYVLLDAFVSGLVFTPVLISGVNPNSFADIFRELQWRQAIVCGQSRSRYRGHLCPNHADYNETYEREHARLQTCTWIKSDARIMSHALAFATFSTQVDVRVYIYTHVHTSRWT